MGAQKCRAYSTWACQGGTHGVDLVRGTARDMVEEVLEGEHWSRATETGAGEQTGWRRPEKPDCGKAGAQAL